MQAKMAATGALLAAVLAMTGCEDLLSSAVPAWGPELTAVTASNTVITFSHTDPGAIDSSKKITGLHEGDEVVAIDYRPVDSRLYEAGMPPAGGLYALGSSGWLYLLDPATGVARDKAWLHPAGGDAFAALAGKSFGMSFNPEDGLLTVVSDRGQNLRVDADTGEVMTQTGYGDHDMPLTAAFTTQPNGAIKTTLYLLTSKGEIDSVLSPSEPRPVIVGSLGVDFAPPAALCIRGNESKGVSYAVLGDPKSGTSSLYAVKLGVGTVRNEGSVGVHERVRAIAIRLALES